MTSKEQPKVQKHQRIRLKDPPQIDTIKPQNFSLLPMIDRRFFTMAAKYTTITKAGKSTTKTNKIISSLDRKK